VARTIAAATKAKLYAPETSEAFLLCVTIDEANLPEPIRLVYNTESITRTAGEFLPMYFSVQLPPDDGQSMGQSTLSIDNVDRQIVEAVKLVVGKPTFTIEAVVASDPNQVIYGPHVLEAEGADWDRNSVTARAVTGRGMRNAYPNTAHRRTQAVDPGIY